MAVYCPMVGNTGQNDAYSVSVMLNLVTPEMLNNDNYEPMKNYGGAFGFATMVNNVLPVLIESGVPNPRPTALQITTVTTGRPAS